VSTTRVSRRPSDRDPAAEIRSPPEEVPATHTPPRGTIRHHLVSAPSAARSAPCQPVRTNPAAPRVCSLSNKFWKLFK
jgi:hypothetical protein